MVNKIYLYGLVSIIITFSWSCQVPELALKEANISVPDTYQETDQDSMNIADIDWRTYFKDERLLSLIDSALTNNQELNIVLQEMNISQNEILEKQAEYLPFVNVGVGAEGDKQGRFTRNGAVEHELEIEPGREFPEPLGDFLLKATASWEVDIWKKLRNAKSAAEMRYLANSQGRQFLQTQLIAEIAESYYELSALDNLLVIVNKNLKIQSDALQKVKQLKENAKATQLAVNRFQAQLQNTTNLQFEIRQKRTETENRINFLVGRFSGDVIRDSILTLSDTTIMLKTGLPSDLLMNRPDIKQAEYNVKAADLSVKSARADFYPALDLQAGIGLQAFNPKFLVNPESIIFNIAGDMVAPLINKKAIRARYNMASAAQVQAVIEYQQSILNAYVDVQNHLAKLDNAEMSVASKNKEVEILNESVKVANSLFKFAKADYVEVLLTQEEALDAQMELVESKLKHWQAKIGLYRALGGGWN